MDSRLPADKVSTRRRFGKWARNLVSPTTDTLSPQSHTNSQCSGTSAALSTSVQPMPSGSPSRINNSQSIKSTTVELDGTSKGLDTSSPENTGIPKPATTEQLKATKNIAWYALENTLRILEMSASRIPPLESAIGGFIACLDFVQAAASNQEDYEEMAAELKMIVETLNPYISNLDEQSHEVAELVSSIEAQVVHISKQGDRGKARQVIESSQDKEDVIKCYRKMEKLFRQLQNLLALQSWETINKQRTDSLLQSLSPADEVIYNSSYSHTIKRRACTKDTRKKIRSDLQDWVRDPNSAKIYWMNGMAGTGKTTIAYSLCEWLEANSKLGASFFFSRASGSCDDITRFIPTIAHQLARRLASFRSALLKVLDTNPGVSRLDVEKQFQKLLHEPMREAKDSGALLEEMVIVIDALDECSASREMKLVLQMLLKFVKNLPVKFFLTSRPEYHITQEMNHLPTVIHLHDIEQSIVEEDIKKYLTEALSGISPPPSAGEIAQLANQSGKLFIYATTIVRYVYPERTRVDSRARLRTMLAIDTESSGKIEPGGKYRELDRLYAAVLAAAFSDDLEPEEMRNKEAVLWTIVCLKEPLTTSAIAMLLDITEDQVLFEVQSLQSVLHLSEKTKLVSTLHASFLDYMLTPLRSNIFHCDESYHDQLLVNCCFKVMEQQLRFNICRLESSSIFDKSVPDLERRTKEFISPELFYACRYWGEHLQTVLLTEDLGSQLVDFLSQRLLFWMEVLNLQECGGPAIRTMEQAKRSLRVAAGMSHIQQVSEAQDFVTRFFSTACSQSTPHIYISALPSYWKASTIYDCYWKRTCKLITIAGTMADQRNQRSMSIWTVGSEIRSIAISPDGRYITSGSRDNTIRVWDAQTGDPVAKPFVGHTEGVNSVAYSPGGTHIVSGSDDRTIRVWDARTGNVVIGPFVGRTGRVASVAYSPDGMRIVSGSIDHSVQVWDAYTGESVIDSFKGYTGYIVSVSYSPDGTRIVSGSSDGTVQVWDADAGVLVGGPFIGHTNFVRSVIYSPDGRHIASGSDDHTIRVWDTHAGSLVAGPFEGHTGWIMSVAYSLDGARIVSGSRDNTIRVWDAHTGSLVVGPFNGHTGHVNSIAYSPDGMRIVSGSQDTTVRVWSAQVDTVVADQSEGHTDCIRSVALSPDGMRIVSGSDDRTIRVWDAHTGKPLAGPFEWHTGYINSVAYSPDGTRIVSSSSDGTIQVRDAHIGSLDAGPFEGHTGWVNSVSYSPDGMRIVSGSDDKTIRVWDAHTGKLVTGPFEGHTGSVESVAFSPDSARIISGSHDKTIRVWDAHSGNLVTGPFAGHTSYVTSVAYSPDGTHIVSSSKDQTVRVWDAHTGNLVTDPFRGHTLGVNSVAYSPDGKLIASASDDGTTLVWGAQTGDVVAGPFPGRTFDDNSVAFTPDGTHVISGSGSKKYSVATACGIRKIRVHPLQKQPPALAGAWSFQPDGWITVDEVPLFWCPPDFHNFIPRTWESLVIGPRGSIAIDYSDLALGDNWTECYVDS